MEASFMHCKLKAARKEPNGAAMVDGGKQKDPEKKNRGQGILYLLNRVLIFSNIKKSRHSLSIKLKCKRLYVPLITI